MGELEKEKTELACPGCGKEIELTYRDMITRREAKCRRCGSTYKFKSLDASRLRSAINDFERAERKFGVTFQSMVKGAEVLLKK